MSGAASILSGSPYVGYLYSYPHKSAYRQLRPRALSQVWAAEDKRSLFLYMHVPFCEMRCGFCNLFTSARPKSDAVSDFAIALERQARVTRDALGSARFAQMAVGGGTPTYLDPAQLSRVFEMASDVLAVDLAAIPISVETSPETATPERLRVLRGYRVDRISIGVQSFVDQEVRGIGRAQRAEQVDAALDAMRSAGFSTLNIDLMFGLPGQTPQTWLDSIRRALRFAPEELYLYPLYVRPLTGLGKLNRSWDDERLALYRLGRDYLLSNGYEQVSLRMFRTTSSAADTATTYRCQKDGMVGLGPGARSYTDRLHYSSDYAVSAKGVRGIIDSYNAKTESDLSAVDYGVELDDADRRRRYAILSLLSSDGLDTAAYRDRFGAAPFDHLPELADLLPLGLAENTEGFLRLTPVGLERSDAIGPWLQSARIRELMGGFQLR